MKVFFSSDCFWDGDNSCVMRSGKKVKITPSQQKLLQKLISNNGKMVSHEELYFAMTKSEPYGEYKTSLSNQFTRNKENEKGLLIRVPEIADFFESSKSLVGGGYMLNIPSQNIVQEQQQATNNEGGISNKIWYSNNDFINFERQAMSNDSRSKSKLMRSYLQGGRCTWPLIFGTEENSPVRRDVIDEIIDRIENESGVLVLAGAGGEGKTTILMQLCIELYKNNKNVLFHAPTNKYDIPENYAQRIYIVDNPSNSREFKQFLSAAISLGETVIVAVRSNEWNILKESLFEDVRRDIKEIELPRISKTEACRFADCILSNMNSINRSRDELTSLFYRDSYGFLYASMLMAIFNCESLEDIAYQMLEKVCNYEKSYPCLKILAAIVFSEHINTPVNNWQYKTLCKELDVDERDPKYYLKMELCLNGTLYQTRHKSISNLFYRYLFVEGSWRNFLNSDEIEDVICALANSMLVDIERLNKDLNPKDIRVINTSSIMAETINYVGEGKCADYLLQRMVEACRQHGHAIIERSFHSIKNNEIKIKLGQRGFDEQLPLWEAYKHWIELSDKTAKEQSTILSQICLWENSPRSLWLIWAKIEEELENIGSYEKEGSASWILFQVLNKYIEDGSLWKNWIDFVQRNIKCDNDADPNLNIRSLYRTACIQYKCRNHIWIDWADYEIKEGNIGNYDIEGSAAWIYQQACANGIDVSDGHGWLMWSKFANKHPEISTKLSANEILKMACIEKNAGTAIWNEWHKEALRTGNVGTYEIEECAAWIIKEVCLKHNPTGDPVVWYSWLQFVDEYPDIDKQISKLDIFRLACKEMKTEDSHLWVLWAKEETCAGNIGNYQASGTAAWIYKNGAEGNFDADGHIWIEWANFVEEFGKVLDDGEEYTPQAVLKVACMEHDAKAFVWSKWGLYEEKADNIGNYETQYSAAWIFKEGCLTHNTTGDTVSILRWAQFAHKYPMYDLNGNYIDAEYILDWAYEKYPTFHNQTWDDLIKFMESIGYQKK